MPSNLKISYLKISLNNNCGKNKIVKVGPVKFNPQLVTSKKCTLYRSEGLCYNPP